MIDKTSSTSVVKTRLANDDIWYASFNGTISNLSALLGDPEKFLGIAFDPFSPITIVFVYNLNRENDDDGLSETYVAEGVIGANFITVNCPLSKPFEKNVDLDIELEDYLRIPTSSKITVKWIDSPKLGYAHYDPQIDKHKTDSENDLLKNTAELIRRPELLPPFLNRREIEGKFVQSRQHPTAQSWATTDVAKENIKVAFKFPKNGSTNFRFTYQTDPKHKFITSKDFMVKINSVFKILEDFLIRNMQYMKGILEKRQELNSEEINKLFELDPEEIIYDKYGIRDELMPLMCSVSKYLKRIKGNGDFDPIPDVYLNDVSLDEISFFEAIKFDYFFAKREEIIAGPGLLNSDLGLFAYLDDNCICAVVAIINIARMNQAINVNLDLNDQSFLLNFKNDIDKYIKNTDPYDISELIIKYKRDIKLSTDKKIPINADDVAYIKDLESMYRTKKPVYDAFLVLKDFINLLHNSSGKFIQYERDMENLLTTENALTFSDCIKVAGTYEIDTGINIIIITITEATQFRWIGAVPVTTPPANGGE